MFAAKYRNRTNIKSNISPLRTSRHEAFLRIFLGNAVRGKPAHYGSRITQCIERHESEINRAGTIRGLLHIYRYFSANAGRAMLCVKLSPLPMWIFLLPRTRSFFARRIMYAPGVIAQCDCKRIYRPGSPECSGTDAYIFAGISVRGFRIICSPGI
jgi:hypothetical protein